MLALRTSCRNRIGHCGTMPRACWECEETTLIRLALQQNKVEGMSDPHDKKCGLTGAPFAYSVWNISNNHGALTWSTEYLKPHIVGVHIARAPRPVVEL